MRYLLYFSIGKIKSDPNVLRLEFRDGTKCDLKDISRSTTVEIVCGISDMIVDIMEDSTCHYLFKAQSDVNSFARQENKVGDDIYNNFTNSYCYFTKILFHYFYYIISLFICNMFR